MKLKPYTYTFNFITHILVHLIIVNTLEQRCTLGMIVKIKCIIIINYMNDGFNISRYFTNTYKMALAVNSGSRDDFSWSIISFIYHSVLNVKLLSSTT